MTDAFTSHISNTLAELKSNGLMKVERLITSAQQAEISVGEHKLINLCSNNYLGLADNPTLINAASQALDTFGLGMASVRFICGTQTAHRQLETRLAQFLGKDDSILFAACFDANGGLFEPLLGTEDAIVSDSLNHASIIDGVRLCKAKRYRYANSDMQELEDQLKQARKDGARFIMIATDGVFSMDGYLAKLPEISALAKQYDALVMVDDCHSTGILGPNGRGTPAHFKTRVDVLSGTLGKALGGSIGGYIAGAQPVIDLLRQKARPYLFSNSLPPAVVAAGLAVIDLVEQGDDLRHQLFDNAKYWRSALEALGFELLSGEHPIIPVMLGDAHIAQQMATQLFKEGVFVSGFFFPVVPEGQARIRTQMSASLSRDNLDRALQAFERAGKSTGVLA